MYVKYLNTFTWLMYLSCQILSEFILNNFTGHFNIFNIEHRSFQSDFSEPATNRHKQQRAHIQPNDVQCNAPGQLASQHSAELQHRNRYFRFGYGTFYCIFSFYKTFPVNCVKILHLLSIVASSGWIWAPYGPMDMGLDGSMDIGPLWPIGYGPHMAQ